MGLWPVTSGCAQTFTAVAKLTGSEHTWIRYGYGEEGEYWHLLRIVDLQHPRLKVLEQKNLVEGIPLSGKLYSWRQGSSQRDVRKDSGSPLEVSSTTGAQGETLEEWRYALFTLIFRRNHLINARANGVHAGQEWIWTETWINK